ncbi:MAG: sulfatase-like hydrolase/transferase, partial [Myxococcales bacterium]|nr:sulfatase-like hydrolase/transferase [Myxococcales bacterium]
WPRLAVGATGIGLALALHLVNARTLIGLYLPLHRALSEGTLAVLLATAVVGLSGLPLRALLGAVAVLGGTAAAMAPVVKPGPARPGVMFLGTELRHIAEAVEPAFDRDGDGIPPAPYGGDCDDRDPAVHPLAFEVTANGKDDNCRLGDRPRGAARPTRPAATPPGLLTWRAAHPQPNVLLIFIDTWRWDHLSPELTPALSALAARSTVFTQARTTAPRTPLAWMSLLRGRFLGRCLTCRARLTSPGSQTVVHRLQAAGYETYGRFVGRSWKRYHGVGGFSRQHQADSVQTLHGERVVADVRRWLRALQGKPEPFLLMGHFADPHAPYKPNDLFPAGPGLRGRYAAEVRYTDHHLGRLLKDLERFGRMEDTIIAVFADHGENLGEHGDAGGHHGVSLFDEVVRVPLLLYVPGVGGRTVDAPVSLVDLAPTLLELTGAQALPDTDGRSLAGYLFDAPPPPAPTVSEFYDFGHRLRAVVHGRFKLIHDVHHDVRLLFDVVSDPHERQDLLAARPDVAAELQGWLDAWVERGADAGEPLPGRCNDLVPRPKDGLEDAKAKRDKAKKKERGAP